MDWLKLFILFFVILLFSCDDNSSSSNKNLNEFRKVLFATDEIQSEFYLYDLKTEAYTKVDVFSDNSQLPGRVEKIYKFGKNYYLLIPEANSIFIIDDVNYKYVDEIKFDEGYEPFEIAFAENSTTAYVIHKSKDIVSVIDLTENQVAKEITNYVLNPKDIFTDGNVLFVANFSDNSVSMFSTIDESLINKFQVSPGPFQITVTNKDRDLLVISSGLGKYDSLSTENTPAAATYLNPETGELISSFELSYGNINAVDVVPFELINTSNDFAFLRDKNYLLFLNARIKQDVRLFYFKEFDGMYYDVLDALLYLSENNGANTTISVSLISTNTVESTINLNHKVSAFIITK